MKAVISVLGKDRTGIIYHVSHILFENNVNILDISQTIMQTMFTMVMYVDISDSKTNFEGLKKQLEDYGTQNALQIHAQHEDIFNSMHRI